ncbi:Histidine kinase-, DNA gyrase B-, and HSP90-like ATPase [Asanoa hainanensis]|uniref:Histidine kinase-, DNA gyrase B-, and HSP90-like ATPase n=1 Tax=Asanoa hainanensis TaxID=560556 RepID=A0A239M256_9ACTN|nr:ATP-binding protein [Asanoa hainanensis]SNT36392.1 Histidine kinase-, DNA gyrase B-, and HSP90-like ATPase [Asanoa hainanensis]
MRRVHLEAAEDHVQRLARLSDPLGAVKELVWNALDADATRVDVVLHRSPLGAVERVTVRDDGTGMAPEALAAAFDRIGGSWKKWTAGTLLKQRTLHGSNGQGRLRAYALGDHLRWTTVADGVGGRSRTEVSAHAGARNDFLIGDSEPTRSPTGTLVEAWGKQSPRLDRLALRANHRRLTTELAPYLTAYPEVTVVYDGVAVDPRTSVQRTTVYPLSFADGEEAALKVIEWSSPVDRELHLCDQHGIPVGSVDVGIRAPGFDFTAYVLWHATADHVGDVHLGDGHDSEVTALVAAAREQLRAHFRGRADDRRREVVESWRTAGDYPYNGDGGLEQETFDLVATTVHRHIPRRGNQRRATLALLREVLRARPDRVADLLGTIFKLSDDDRSQLDRVLRETDREIRAATTVADRLEVIAALRRLTADGASPDPLRAVLADNAWVFGERHGLLAADRTLDVVLDRHAGPDADLLVARTRREHERLQHLVVLGSDKAGAKDLTQLRAYAEAVAADTRYRGIRVDWEVWLVVGTSEVGGTGGGVRVRTWNEVLLECTDRVRFFEQSAAYPDRARRA